MVSASKEVHGGSIEGFSVVEEGVGAVGMVLGVLGVVAVEPGETVEPPVGAVGIPVLPVGAVGIPVPPVGEVGIPPFGHSSASIHALSSLL